MPKSILYFVTFYFFLVTATYAQNAAIEKQKPEPLGIAMEGFEYPFEVKYLRLNLEGQDVRMAYMDVNVPGDQTVVLFHGKNFFGAYWKETIEKLAEAGYRVVVPDQIGFGKSSKPNIHYSFPMLAANTKQLLDTLQIESAAIVGHSMGGMLATRFALMYPETTERLILENPIGLEDYKPIVPYATIEAQYKSTLALTEESIRKYQESYYVNWSPEYETYVQVHYRWTLSGEYPRLAWASALTADMIYNQPVAYEFSDIKVPTLLIIGQADRTVVGKNRVPREDLDKVGQYPRLGKKVAETIPDAQLIEIENVGHIPHFEAKDQFYAALLKFVAN